MIFYWRTDGPMKEWKAIFWKSTIQDNSLEISNSISIDGIRISESGDQTTMTLTKNLLHTNNEQF